MRLVTFRHGHETGRLGAVVGDDVVDLNAGCARMLNARGLRRFEEAARAVAPADMIGFLDGGQESLAAAAETLDFVSRLERSEREGVGLCFPIDRVTLQAPVPRPRKLVLLGLNYRDHAEETGMKLPEVPTLFSKYPSSVIGPGETILVPKVSSMIDYEAEMAFVIGRAGKNVPRERAMEHVAGYTILNDVTCRDYQARTGQWMIGKTFDSFAPMGPYLVLKDEVPDPHDLEVALDLNGRRMQHSSTRHLIFTVPEIIAYISQVFTIEPGDVVSTGTPSGVGFARKPPVFLKPGDRVRIEIERLGVLENPVGGE